LYSLVEQLVPGSFSVANYFRAAESSGIELSLANESATVHFTVFLYFSYTTLTTLGYGDIIPASNAARFLTSLEAIAGVLYEGAFVARLISVYTRDKKL
jgi:hypothetical protein